MKPRNPPRKPRTKPVGGRPRKVDVVAAVGLQQASSTGVDPALVDPLRILAGIAADDKAPAPARVAACKVLLKAGPGDGKPAMPDTPQDALTRRTLALMKRGRPN